MSRALRALYWLLPIAFCLWLYWLGLRIWFEKDDFAWLGLRNQVTDFKSFLWAMFHPLAQGTVRPFSERGFFMLFSWFFGLRSLPYRLFVFLNQFLNILLVMLVTRKLTKSRLAGFVAPLLWLACPALMTPMSWSAAYNEIQCATFLLLSFYLFLRYTETGERKYYWAQLVTFLLGFGSLEINIVFPAIAAVYAFLFARRYLLSTLPLFGISLAYAIVHRTAAAGIGSRFYYEMNFHPQALLSTSLQYWKILLGAPAFVTFMQWRNWLLYISVGLLTTALLGFVAWQTWKRRYLPLFCLCWYLLVLGPLLPLINHVTEYYLAIPAIGIAMLGAHALSMALQRGRAASIAAIALTLLYFIPSTSIVRAQMRWAFDGADRVRGLVQSVAYAKRIHPGKTILLKDVDDDLFWGAVYDSPFRIFGWNDIFMTPDCRPLIHEDLNMGMIDPYFLPASAVSRVLHDGAAVVYAVEDRRLRNVTRPYTALIDSQPPPPLSHNISAGLPYYKDQLGEGWYGSEVDHRWSSGHAVVYLAGPSAPGQKLYIQGSAVDLEVKPGPLHLALTVDGRPEPVKTIDRSNMDFQFSYDLPSDLVGHPKIEIAFSVDRTTQTPTDDRHLGLAFGEFTIR